jgi:hypothetical protein
MSRLGGLDAAAIGSADRREDERESGDSERDRQSTTEMEVVAQRVKS